MKQSVLQLMFKTGVFTPFRLAHRSQAIILCYHRFSQDEASEATPVKLLAENICYLKKHYSVVPLSEIAVRLRLGKSISGLAALTIDDGYSDAYELAYPVLRQYEVPATLFVMTDFLSRQSWLWTDKMRYIAVKTQATELTVKLNDEDYRAALNGRSSRYTAADNINSKLKRLPDEIKEQTLDRIAHQHGVELPALPPDEFNAITWEQAREMDANGVAIESHTVTHPILTQVGSQRLNKELSGARQKLELELERPVHFFCYPDGAFNARVRDAVARAGYQCAVTTRHGFADVKSDLLTLRRIHGEADQAHFVQATSGFEEFKLRWRGIHK